MKTWIEKCAGCGKEFVNNSGCTSFGCPDCDPKLKAEEARLRGIEPPAEDPIEKAYRMYAAEGCTHLSVCNATGLSREVAEQISDMQLRNVPLDEINLELMEEL
jgi:hypothetical protein